MGLEAGKSQSGTQPFSAATEFDGVEKNISQREASSIKLAGLTMAYGKTVVLRDLDLEVQAGEFFTLLGPSGSGKTTILRLLAGFEHPNAGSIAIGGKEVAAMPPNKRSVNTVFQSYALFAHMTVRENIGFGPRMLGWNKARIHARIEEVTGFIEIGNLLDRRIEQLSGGQRQRVALARALINEPDVLLLDEPLSALDAGLRTQLQVELRRIQRRLGMTFVFVTHDQHEALVMSDRIAVLNDGRLQQVAAPRELYERPANLFVAAFMGHTNVFEIERRQHGSMVTALGEISANAKSEGSGGAHILVRPEAVRVFGADARGDNQFAARVDECIYRGDFVEYRLDCQGVKLAAKNVNRGENIYQEGDQVTATFNASAVEVLHD